MALKFKCSSCLHFKKVPHPQFEDLCSKLGIQGYSPAPTCYTPNIYEIKQTPDFLATFGLLVQQLKPAEVEILQGLMHSSGKLLKMNLRFGSPVYFCTGRDYLSNYLKGVVVGLMGAGKTNTVCVIGNASQLSVGSTMMGFIPASSLMSPKEFKAKAEALKASGKVNDPQVKKGRRISTKAEAKYEPPTLDTDPDKLAAKARRPSRFTKEADGSKVFRV